MREPKAAGRGKAGSFLRRNRTALGLLAVPAVAGAVALVVLGQALRPASGEGSATGGAPVGTASADGGPSASATSAVVGLGARATPTSTSKAAPQPARSGFPGASNTGVPPGTNLQPYRGPCTITAANTVIEAKTVTCSLLIRAKNVVIKKSTVAGTIRAEGGGNSLRVEDSEVDGGRGQEHTVGFQNVTVLRSDIQGGQTSVNCYSNCLIQDSWLHGQYLPEGADWHLDAFLSNGGSDIRLIHNTLACDRPSNSNGGGCTANAAIFGDFGPNSNYTFDSNLFVASQDVSYCLYGGLDAKKPYGTQVQDIVVVNNMFQRGSNGKCGFYGPVTSFDEARGGNVWRDNVWDDGKPVSPSL